MTVNIFLIHALNLLLVNILVMTNIIINATTPTIAKYCQSKKSLYITNPNVATVKIIRTINVVFFFSF